MPRLPVLVFAGVEGDSSLTFVRAEPQPSAAISTISPSSALGSTEIPPSEVSTAGELQQAAPNRVGVSRRSEVRRSLLLAPQGQRKLLMDLFRVRRGGEQSHARVAVDQPHARRC